MPLNTKRQTKTGTAALLPNGPYRLVIEKVEEKLGPSGHPYYNFRLRPIVNGTKASQAIWDKISLSPDARFRVDAFLDAVGVEDVDQDLEPRWFEGKSYWAVISNREYQGQWSNEVKQYLTAEAAEALLDKLAEENGSGEATLISTERKTRPAPERVAAGKKSSSRVAELSGEDSPF